MARERARPQHLEAKNCYVGQTVYWLMWYDPEGPVDKDGMYTGWHNYRPGLRPEIWSRKIVRLTPKTITLVNDRGDEVRPKGLVYSCPQDAITAEYEHFCRWQVGAGYGYSKPKVSLGKASVFLQLLARLEFDLNTELQRIEKPSAEQTDDTGD
jgi:hypothetical protein